MRPQKGWKINQECDCKRNCTKESFRIEEVLIGHWLLPNVLGKQFEAQKGYGQVGHPVGRPINFLVGGQFIQEIRHRFTFLPSFYLH